MTVTALEAHDTVQLLRPRDRAAIELAVAQWVGSERCASAAREELRALGEFDGDIERYRRADAADPALRTLLRFSIMILIARGRVDPRTVRRLRPRLSDALLAEVAEIVARAYLRVTLVESLDLDLHTPRLAMAIGDY